MIRRVGSVGQVSVDYAREEGAGGLEAGGRKRQLQSLMVSRASEEYDDFRTELRDLHLQEPKRRDTLLNLGRHASGVPSRSTVTVQPGLSRVSIATPN